MSEAATQAENTVTIEIDGRQFQAQKGAMIIQAADAVGVYIPRFCYHPKLQVAANCRVCMVQVEMNGRPSPKPLPACATPVADGMKVETRSDLALNGQRNALEFILINHPLDCPICDQGGECELQDLAMGYGRTVSRFTERKRNVADEDVGPLVETFMTRCIHCTRCVRVLDEIAGTNEFGGMNRGEHLEIGTYIGKSIESELSGNIIDVCPVGALTDKVFKFQARAWELVAHESVSFHDALGSNMWLHVRHGKILRAVPRDNEAVNECWLADRDRYSHQGLYHDDRITRPMVRDGDGWKAVSWDDAMAAVRKGLEGIDGKDIGVLANPASSCEEGFLLRRLADGLGTANIDHRLRRLDCSGGASTGFEMPVEDIKHADATLLVGSYLRHELPLVNHRVRDSVFAASTERDGREVFFRDHHNELHAGKVFVLSCLAQEFNYPLAGHTVVPPQDFLGELLVWVAAAVETGKAGKLPARLKEALDGVEVTDAAREAIKTLAEADKTVVMFGHLAAMHPQAGWLHAAAKLIASATGSAFNEVPLGTNSIGLGRVGVLPHDGGLDARAMQGNPRKAYMLFGAEAPYDFADGGAIDKALEQAGFVVAAAAYGNEVLRQRADVLLPLAPLPMSPATLVNVDGAVQAVDAAVAPVAETQSEYRAMGQNMPQPQLPADGEVLEGWKILRRMGQALELDGFDISAIADVREAMAGQVSKPLAGTAGDLADRGSDRPEGLVRVDTVPIYRGDAVLRRAKALNEHPLTRPPEAVLAPADAEALGVDEDGRVRVGDVELPVRIDARVAAGSVWIQSTHEATWKLPPMGSELKVTKA